jgi:hypothetical protein
MLCLTSYSFENFENNLPAGQLFEYFGTIFVHTHTHTHTHLIIIIRARKIIKVFRKSYIAATCFFMLRFYIIQY